MPYSSEAVTSENSVPPWLRVLVALEWVGAIGFTATAFVLLAFGIRDWGAWHMAIVPLAFSAAAAAAAACLAWSAWQTPRLPDARRDQAQGPAALVLVALLMMLGSYLFGR